MAQPTTLRKIRQLDQSIRKLLNHNLPKDYNFVETFCRTINDELNGHPLFLPKLFASIIVGIEGKHEMSLHLLHQDIFNYNYDPLFIQQRDVWTTVKSFFQRLNDAQEFWTQYPNTPFVLQLTDGETQEEVQLLELFVGKKHIYKRNIYLLIAMMQSVWEKALNQIPLINSNTRFMTQDFFELLKNPIEQASKLVISVNDQGTSDEELAITQSAIFCMISILRCSNSEQVIHKDDIRNLINSLNEPLTSMANIRAAYGIFKSPNYTQLTSGQLYRLQLEILSQATLDACWKNSPNYFQTDDDFELAYGNWILKNDVFEIAYGNWLLGNDGNSQFYRPVHLDISNLQPAAVYYYAEMLILTQGEINIGCENINKRFKLFLNFSSLKFTLTKITYDHFLEDCEIKTNLSANARAIRPQLIGILFDAKQKDDFLKLRFFVNGVEVIPDREKMLELKNELADENTKPLTFYSLKIYPAYYQQVVLIRRAEQWQFGKNYGNVIEFPVFESCALMESYLLNEPKIDSPKTDEPENAQIWPLENEYITRRIFAYMDPISLFNGRLVSRLFAMYAREVAAKVTHLTLISDNEAAFLINNEKDSVETFFYTNADGSSFLTVGNVEKCKLKNSYLNFNNNLADLGPHAIANYFPNVKTLVFSQRLLMPTFFWPLMELLKCWSEQLTRLSFALFTENQDVFGIGPELVPFVNVDDKNQIICGKLLENLIFSLNNLPNLKSLTFKYAQVTANRTDSSNFAFLRHLETFYFVGELVYCLGTACSQYLLSPLQANPPTKRRLSFLSYNYHVENNRMDYHMHQPHYLFLYHMNLFFLGEAPPAVAGEDVDGTEIFLQSHLGTIFPTKCPKPFYNTGDSFQTFLRAQPSLELLDLQHNTELPTLGTLTDLISVHGPKVRFINSLVISEISPPLTSGLLLPIVPLDDVKGLKIRLCEAFNHKRFLAILKELHVAFPKLNCLRIRDSREFCKKCETVTDYKDEAAFLEHIANVTAGNENRVKIDSDFEDCLQNPQLISCFFYVLNTVLELFPKTMVVYEIN